MFDWGREALYINSRILNVAVPGKRGGLSQNAPILVLKEGTPLNNVWLTMLQGVGVDAKSHGDSTGIVSELQA